MEYINYIKARTQTTFAFKSADPVLSEEDEKFLTKITSDDNPRPFSPSNTTTYSHGGDAQLALMDGAQNIALPPDVLDEITDQDGEVKGELPSTRSLGADDNANDSKVTQGDEKEKDGKQQPRARTTWSWLRRDSRDRRAADQTSTADSLHDIATTLKPADAKPNEDETVSDAEARKEEEDMTIVLEKLNLAAVNNRVFSISNETQELLQKFNQVFKDLVQGLPTAYDDLESLLTNGDKQIQKTFDNLPPFMQKLIKKLPESLTKGIGPGVLAAATESSNSQSKSSGRAAGKIAGEAAGKFLKTPSLKDLVAKPSGIAALLRSIMTFLRQRFPAFFGMNVLWSLAMFVLLIVFWYCHKRGREVRLEKERDLTEQELLRLDVEWRALHPGTLATSAAIGAPIEEVKAGVREIDSQRNEADSSEQALPSDVSHTKP